MLRALALAALLAPALALAAGGGSPLTLAHSGYVLDANDQPLENATQAMTFRLFDDATAGAAQWEASCTVAVRAGYYAVELGGGSCAGSDTLDTADLPATAARWLEVTLDGTALAPRVPVGAAPVAATARESLDAQLLKSQLAAAGGTLNGASNPVDWSRLKGVPAAFADEVDDDTQYTAAPGGGLALASGAFGIAAGGVTNAMLANREVTITAGAGLSGGGALALGGATTLAIANGGVTNTMLANAQVTVGAGAGLTGGGAITLGSSASLAIGTNAVTNTMLAPDAASLAKVTNGLLSINGTNVGIGLGGAAPTAALHVAGTVAASGIRFGDGTVQTTAASSVGSTDALPYGAPTYWWDGGCNGSGCTVGLSSELTSRMSTRGTGAIDVTSYAAGWNLKAMYRLTGVSADNSGATMPTNGIYVELPVTPGVHNQFLLSSLEDRWSVWSVWVVNQAGTAGQRLMRNSNGGNCASSNYTSHMMGPFNGTKETMHHAWLPFPLTASQIASYAYTSGSETRVKLLLATNANNTDGLLQYLSGVAMVPNPAGLVQVPAVAAYWNLNGSGNLASYGCWNSSWMGMLNNNTTQSISVKVVDPTKDVLVTLLTHGDNWYEGSPYIRVGTDTTTLRLALGLRGLSAKMYSGMLYHWPMTLRIPAAIAQAQTNADGVLKLTFINTQSNNFYIRGIDTEIAP